MIDYQARAETLIQALPYIQRFAGKTVVVKYGGHAMTDPDLKLRVMRDLVLMQVVGIKPVLVHGGGPEIDRLMERMGLQPKRVGGMRVTDAETMELVEMALAGSVNKALVAGVEAAGGRAVGLSGKDGAIFRARKITPDGHDIGFVGEIVEVRTDLLTTLTEGGYLPVLCSVAVDAGYQTYNVNADLAAGALAAALKAEKLIVMTDVPGVMREYPKIESLISSMTVTEARGLVGSGVIEKGMIPKIQACVDALEGGVRSAHIIDGRTPHSLLIEVFTDAGIGTMIAGPG